MSGLTLDSALKLPSGKLMPALGFGVYQARGSDCESAVKEAIKAGYRHGTPLSELYYRHTIAETLYVLCAVDSAQAYHNEDSRSHNAQLGLIDTTSSGRSSSFVHQYSAVFHLPHNQVHAKTSNLIILLGSRTTPQVTEENGSSFSFWRGIH